VLAWRPLISRFCRSLSKPDVIVVGMG
jgi:hypothetical protein